MKFFIFTIFLFFPAVNLYAQSDEQKIRAINNFQHEVTNCAGYYSIFHNCLDPEEPEHLKVIKRLEPLIDGLVSNMLKFGLGIGMTEDAIKSRLILSQDAMKKIYRDSCVNLSSLTIRYGNRCRQMTDDPDSIFMEYLSKP